jgi:hypothetical protein
MWCKSVGFVCWLAPLLILRSVGFSVVFCRSVNVRRVSLGIGHNEQGFVQAGHCCLSSPELKPNKGIKVQDNN